ncbi:MAG: S41 family peptidase [Deltaproteobacteria bacterium]|nr:S41 family peptidase [Deltaproteobacteria bacterium]
MKQFRNNKIISAICLLTLLIFIGIYKNNHVSALDRNIYKEIKVFNEILNIVEKNYVEQVEPQTLIQGAIEGMMKSLDPHSTFMTADMYQELEVNTRGSFGGIGTEITILKDVLTVVAPIEDTPAFRAGIKAGDQIIKIDGKSTKDINIMEAVKKLRGPKDTKVTLTIMRKSAAKPLEFIINRAIINIKSVKTKIYDDHIGYIRVASFQERTGDDLGKAVNDIQTKVKTLKGIVLDLRDNPGGLLTQAVDVSDAFLKSGLIVSIKGRAKNMHSEYSAKDDGYEPECPIIVLVNEGTASASEIVSGALQDNGRGIILGTKTFGKGSVQTVIPLEEGAALKLTTAKYYTPSGRSIQAEGINPDIIIRQVKNAYEEESPGSVLREKDLEGHIKSTQKDDEETEDLLKSESDELMSDNQLKSAIDILKSWEVFKKVTSAQNDKRSAHRNTPANSSSAI